jgi:hypothetical protein
MTPEIAKAAIAFLSRVTLRGEEVPAFNKVVESLDELANKETPSPVKKIDNTKK